MKTICFKVKFWVLENNYYKNDNDTASIFLKVKIRNEEKIIKSKQTKNIYYVKFHKGPAITVLIKKEVEDDIDVEKDVAFEILECTLHTDNKNYSLKEKTLEIRGQVISDLSQKPDLWYYDDNGWVQMEDLF